MTLRLRDGAVAQVYFVRPASTIGQLLAGEIYEFRDGRLLAFTALHLDQELVKLHGAADPERVWTFHPNVVNLEGEL